MAWRLTRTPYLKWHNPIVIRTRNIRKYSPQDSPPSVVAFTICDSGRPCCMPGTTCRTGAPMKLVCGNSNRAVAEAIASYLEVPLTNCLVRRFADQEIFVEIKENVRGDDTFVIQSTSYPANDNLMELLIIIDALRRASSRRV